MNACKCLECSKQFIPTRCSAGRFCSRKCYWENMIGKERKTDMQAFWKRVNKTDNCWVWIGPVNANGYGILNRKGKLWLAHRYSWFLANGAIPVGMMVCHNCPDGDNPACVNPSHLWLGDQSDNMRDAGIKGRCWNPRAKLTKQIADKIREIKQLTGCKQVTIAKQFGISANVISLIIRNRIWR